MIEIAICDDEQYALDCITKEAVSYGAEKGIDFSVDRFSDALALEEEMQNGKRYQIYILDMLMPKMNGIEIGKEIRKRDQQAVIICMTSTKDFAYQAYGIYAQRYLLKPLKRAEIFEAFDFAVASVRKLGKMFYVNTADGLFGVLCREIEYVENSARTLHIFTSGGKEITSRFLRNSFESDVSELLGHENFIQVHKSFVVNLDHVKIYDMNQITMRSEKQIPISKSRQAAVKRFYLKYISEQY